MTCHPDCALGPDRDHPGYLEYRCIDEAVNALPFPGETATHCDLCPFRGCTDCPHKGGE